MSAILSTAPQSISRVLDTSFKLYFRTLKPCFFVALSAALLQAVPYLFVPVMDASDPFAFYRSFGIGLIAAFLVVMLILTVVYAGLIDYQGMIGRGFEQSMSQSLQNGARRIPGLLGGFVIAILATALGLLALVVGAFYVFIVLFFWAYSLMLEGNGTIASMKRSMQLVKGNFWRVVVMLLVPFALQFALGGLVATFTMGYVLVASIQTGQPPTPEQMHTLQAWSQLLNAPVTALSMPLMVAVGVTIFNDLVVRADGGDLIERIETSSS